MSSHFEPHAGSSAFPASRSLAGCAMLCRWLFPGMAIVTALFAWMPAAWAEATEISRIADIRALSPGAAAKSPLVRVKGTITFRYTPNSWSIQDESAGIWVSANRAREKGVWEGDAAVEEKVSVGSVVEIEGVADPGGFAPTILPRTIRIVGRGELPPALELRPEALTDGADDSRLIWAEGLVVESSSLGRTGRLLRLDSIKGSFFAVVTVSDALAAKLVGARIRIEGIFASNFNSRSEFVSLRLVADGDQNLRILEPAPTDPFDAPKVPLGELAIFSPAGSLLRRQKVEGTVTFAAPGSHFYLQDGESAIRVSTPEKDLLRVGDRVEASGFVDRTRIVAGMTGAAVRKIGAGAAPAPSPVDWPALERALGPILRGTRVASRDYDGKLLQADGELLQIFQSADGAMHLNFRVGTHVDSALLPPLQSNEERKKLAAVSPGCVVRLTGVGEFDYLKSPRLSREAVIPIRMNLQMRDLNDLRVLQPAPWLTPQRIWLLSGGAGMVLLLLLVWTWLLRREVIRRGTQLAEEISARNAAGLEFDTRLNERKRLAGDLHDTLEQTLIGLSLQLQASELLHQADPERSAQHLRLARQFLDRSREDVHRTVWDLRAHGLDGRSLMVVLRERTLAMVAGMPEKITVESEGETVALPDFIAGNLLLLAQEAVTNALKHAGAHSITVRIMFLPDGVTARVTDDGAGFDPLLAPGQSSGHFGLQGMRERMKRIGGTLQIESRTGAGTRIEASVPARAFAAGPPEPQKVAVRPMAEAD